MCVMTSVKKKGQARFAILQPASVYLSTLPLSFSVIIHPSAAAPYQLIVLSAHHGGRAYWSWRQTPIGIIGISVLLGHLYVAIPGSPCSWWKVVLQLKLNSTFSVAIIMDKSPCCVRHYNYTPIYLCCPLLLHDVDGMNPPVMPSMQHSSDLCLLSSTFGISRFYSWCLQSLWTIGYGFDTSTTIHSWRNHHLSSQM